MTRYLIEQIDTGLALCNGQWSEEPEWFSAAEALKIFGVICGENSSALAIKAHEFDPSECE